MRVPQVLVARRGRVRLRGVRTLKTTVAAVAAYVAALPVSDNPRPVLAPLMALLVVQLTLYETVRAGLRRVVSVTAGVLVAVGVSAFVPLQWWSLAVLIAASLVIARVLRLGAEGPELPISAMLVFAVGGADATAVGRVLETIIGAVVGVGMSALVAPPLYVRPATDAVQALARGTADVLRTISAEVQGEYGRDDALGWLDTARGLGRDILRADRALGQAEDSLRLNPRAMTRRHTGASLRSGLEGLERTAVSLRGVCRSLADRAGGGGPEPVYGPDVRTALSRLLAHLSEAVEAYGAVVGTEVAGLQPEDAVLRDALAAAWRDRDALAAALQQGDRMHVDSWQLHGDLVANADRLLRDLDSDARAELRAGWPVPARPMDVARSRLRRPARRRDGGDAADEPR